MISFVSVRIICNQASRKKLDRIDLSSLKKPRRRSQNNGLSSDYMWNEKDSKKFQSEKGVSLDRLPCCCIKFGAWIHQTLTQRGTATKSMSSTGSTNGRYYQNGGNRLFMVVCS